MAVRWTPSCSPSPAGFQAIASASSETPTYASPIPAERAPIPSFSSANDAVVAPAVVGHPNAATIAAAKIAFMPSSAARSSDHRDPVHPVPAALMDDENVHS